MRLVASAGRNCPLTILVTTPIHESPKLGDSQQFLNTYDCPNHNPLSDHLDYTGEMSESSDAPLKLQPNKHDLSSS